MWQALSKVKFWVSFEDQPLGMKLPLPMELYNKRTYDSYPIKAKGGQDHMHTSWVLVRTKEDQLQFDQE